MSMGNQASRPSRAQIVLDSLNSTYEFSMGAKAKAQEIRIRLLGAISEKVKEVDDSPKTEKNLFDKLDEGIAYLKDSIRDINEELSSVLNELV